jgi:hypothetical protein
VRSLQLQAALTDHIHAAAACLQADVAAGAEVPYELGQRRGRGPLFPFYRPLTSQFISMRLPALQRLASHAEAVRLLAEYDGLDRYLASLGLEPERSADVRARVALQAMLDEVFAEQTDFELRPHRLQAAIERLERSALSQTSELTLVATLHGLAIASPELPLATGLTIAQPDALDGLPAGALTAPEHGPEHLVVVLACKQDDMHEALAGGLEICRDLQRALRLFGDGRVTLGRIAWTRSGGGSWSAQPLGTGGRPHGMLVVTPEQEDELRAFCNLVSRRSPHCDALAWALRRFELGSDRDHPLEGLSDHLLALRTLLEPEGPSSGRLAGRIAALCATPDKRTKLTERMTKAQALEQAFIAGKAGERASSLALARDVAEHLRALLRDVICGHLAPDLVQLADELLSAQAAEAADALQSASASQQATPPAPGRHHSEEDSQPSAAGPSQPQQASEPSVPGPKQSHEDSQRPAPPRARRRRRGATEATPAPEQLLVDA